MDAPDVADWTDGNESDPGVSILEAFAWFALALFFVAGFRAARRRHTRHDD